MNPVHHALLETFAQGHDDLQLATNSQGRVVLLCDQQQVINLIDEPGSDQVWALAMAGRLPLDRGNTAQAPDYGDEWISHTQESDGFEWSVSCNVASGVIALSARAELSSLDAPAFDRWMGAFIERLRATSGVFPAQELPEGQS